MGFKNTLLPVANLLQSKGKLLDLSQPIVMGILNCTPDSFFGASRVTLDDSSVLIRAEAMLRDGASILDIGGYSTRPGAVMVAVEEELSRVIPAISAISQNFPEAWISIDTFRAEVAERAVAAGAHIVNDISGGTLDADLLPVVAALQVPYIAMHIEGGMHNMHSQEWDYDGDITLALIKKLRDLISRCTALGIRDIVVDPGFGFSKTIQQNYELLSSLNNLRILGKPLLAGLSRKSMIYKLLEVAPDQALAGTVALNMIALQQGASILRVHDVKEAMDVIKLFNILK